MLFVIELSERQRLITSLKYRRTLCMAKAVVIFFQYREKDLPLFLRGSWMCVFHNYRRHLCLNAQHEIWNNRMWLESCDPVGDNTFLELPHFVQEAIGLRRWRVHSLNGIGIRTRFSTLLRMFLFAGKKEFTQPLAEFGNNCHKYSAWYTVQTSILFPTLAIAWTRFSLDIGRGVVSNDMCLVQRLSPGELGKSVHRVFPCVRGSGFPVIGDGHIRSFLRIER